MKGADYTELLQSQSAGKLSREQRLFALRQVIQMSMMIESISTDLRIYLHFLNTVTKHSFKHTTKTVILATEYRNCILSILENIKGELRLTPDDGYIVNRNYSVDARDTIFVQNADLRSHGFNSADLGLGPYRNMVIINSICRKALYTFNKGIGFKFFNSK